MTDGIYNETEQPIALEDTTTMQQESLVPHPVINTRDNQGRLLPDGTFNFGYALYYLKNFGWKLARQGWNGKNMWIKLQIPDAHSKMTLPYLYIEYPTGHPAYPERSRVPWLASQTDLLAEDWIVVP